MSRPSTGGVAALLFLSLGLSAAPQTPPVRPSAKAKAAPGKRSVLLRLQAAEGDQLPVLLQQHLLHKVRGVVFFRGQYAELRPLRKELSPWLQKWVRAAPKVPQAERFRSAAMRALRDLQLLARDRAALDALRQVADSRQTAPELRDHAVYMLADLGDRKRLNRLLEEAQAWTRREAPRMRASGFLRLAEASYQLRDYRAAAGFYLRLPPIYKALNAAARDFRMCHYNAACCLSLAGQQAQAAAQLQRAIDLHWVPRESIRRDRDLRGLRRWKGFAGFMRRNYGRPGNAQETGK